MKLVDIWFKEPRTHIGLEATGIDDFVYHNSRAGLFFEASKELVFAMYKDLRQTKEQYSLILVFTLPPKA